MSQGSRPWSEATFGGGTSFEVATSREPTEPPMLPVPEPWPVVPRPGTPGTPGTPPSPMLAPEELDDLQVGTGKRKKKRLRLKKRTPEATSPQSEAVETKESQEQEPRPEIDFRSILQRQVADIEAAKHRLEVACRDELDRLQHQLEHAAENLEQTLSLDHVVPLVPSVPVVPESCALSADFSTLEETPDAKCFGSPGATWSPIQVVISPQSAKEVVGSPDPPKASKHREWSQRFLASGMYAVFAQLITLLSMVVMWLDTEFAAMPLELETQPAWLSTVRVLNWICTICFTVELALRIKAASTCKEMWGSSSRLWNLYDALIVSLAWADEIYILATSSELRILRVARVLRVVRLFRFCQHLEGWAMALVDSLHALLWSVAVMALVLFSASICLTSSCADWVKDQIDSANPGWTDLLEKRDPVDQLNDPKTAELVMNIWAWFGSLPRCSYTLLRCWGGCEAESQALLQVGFFAAAAFQLYFLTMVVVVLNVMLGLVVEAILDSSRDDRRDS